jgi:glycosyltransferase involved in cell wall biosynthesis
VRHISVLIITKNRSASLNKCLQSLAEQKQKPWEIVVVDNGSTDDTKKEAVVFLSTLNLRYFYTNIHGYPKIYNYGLKQCRGTWIVFLDDDCMAGTEWFSAIVTCIQAHPNAIIQGKTVSLPRGNIYAETMGDHYHNWIRANTIFFGQLRTFDNKNLCVPRRIIERYGMFNEDLVYGSEDIELGIRYKNRGVSIMYEPSIIVSHHERDALSGFISQHIRIARSEALLDRQLNKDDKIGVTSSQKILLYIKSFIKRETGYIRRGQILNFLKLPCLYLLLVVLRVWTYYMTTWSIQK